MVSWVENRDTTKSYVTGGDMSRYSQRDDAEPM